MSCGFIVTDAWLHEQGVKKSLPHTPEYFTAVELAVEAVSQEHSAFPTVVAFEKHKYLKFIRSKILGLG